MDVVLVQSTGDSSDDRPVAPTTDSPPPTDDTPVEPSSNASDNVAIIKDASNDVLVGDSNNNNPTMMVRKSAAEAIWAEAAACLESDDELEDALRAMEATQVCVHPQHYHSFQKQASLTAFLLGPLRKCAGCQQSLIAKSNNNNTNNNNASGELVKCLACGVLAHRSCALGNTFQWTQVCQVNGKSIQKEATEALQRTHQLVTDDSDDDDDNNSDMEYQEELHDTASPKQEGISRNSSMDSADSLATQELDEEDQLELEARQPASFVLKKNFSSASASPSKNKATAATESGANIPAIVATPTSFEQPSTADQLTISQGDVDDNGGDDAFAKNPTPSSPNQQHSPTGRRRPRQWLANKLGKATSMSNGSTQEGEEGDRPQQQLDGEENRPSETNNNSPAINQREQAQSPLTKRGWFPRRSNQQPYIISNKSSEEDDNGDNDNDNNQDSSPEQENQIGAKLSEDSGAEPGESSGKASERRSWLPALRRQNGDEQNNINGDNSKDGKSLSSEATPPPPSVPSSVLPHLPINTTPQSRSYDVAPSASSSRFSLFSADRTGASSAVASDNMGRRPKGAPKGLFVDEHFEDFGAAADAIIDDDDDGLYATPSSSRSFGLFSSSFSSELTDAHEGMEETGEMRRFTFFSSSKSEDSQDDNVLVVEEEGGDEADKSSHGGKSKRGFSLFSRGKQKESTISEDSAEEECGEASINFERFSSTEKEKGEKEKENTGTEKRDQNDEASGEAAGEKSSRRLFGVFSSSSSKLSNCQDGGSDGDNEAQLEEVQVEPDKEPRPSRSLRGLFAGGTKKEETPFQSEERAAAGDETKPDTRKTGLVSLIAGRIKGKPNGENQVVDPTFDEDINYEENAAATENFANFSQFLDVSDHNDGDEVTSGHKSPVNNSENVHSNTPSSIFGLLSGRTAQPQEEDEKEGDESVAHHTTKDDDIETTKSPRFSLFGKRNKYEGLLKTGDAAQDTEQAQVEAKCSEEDDTPTSKGTKFSLFGQNTFEGGQMTEDGKESNELAAEPGEKTKDVEDSPSGVIPRFSLFSRGNADKSGENTNTQDNSYSRDEEKEIGINFERFSESAQVEKQDETTKTKTDASSAGTLSRFSLFSRKKADATSPENEISSNEHEINDMEPKGAASTSPRRSVMPNLWKRKGNSQQHEAGDAAMEENEINSDKNEQPSSGNDRCEAAVETTPGSGSKERSSRRFPFLAGFRKSGSEDANEDASAEQKWTPGEAPTHWSTATTTTAPALLRNSGEGDDCENDEEDEGADNVPLHYANHPFASVSKALQDNVLALLYGSAKRDDTGPVDDNAKATSPKQMPPTFSLIVSPEEPSDVDVRKALSEVKEVPVQESTLMKVASGSYEVVKATMAAQQKMGMASVAGSIAGGVAGLMFAGPAGAVMGVRAGQTAGVLGVLLEGSLTVGVVVAGVASGRFTAEKIKEQMEEKRILTIGENGVSRKVMLVRPAVKIDPAWDDISMEAQRSSPTTKASYISLFTGGDDIKKERYEKISDIVETDEHEIPTNDKVLLLVSRVLSDKRSYPGHVYRFLIQSFNERCEMRMERNKDKEDFPHLFDEYAAASRERREDAHAVIKHVTATLLDVRPGLGATPSITEATASVVESLVFGEIYDLVYEEIAIESTEKDKALAEKVDDFEFSRQEKTGENPFADGSVSAEAVDALRRLPEMRSAVDKLRYCVCFLMMVSEHFASNGNSSVMGADSLLKMTCQHIIAAKMTHINAEVAFLEEFARDEQLLRGREGYALVTLQASLHFLNMSNDFERDIFGQDNDEENVPMAGFAQVNEDDSPALNTEDQSSDIRAGDPIIAKSLSIGSTGEPLVETLDEKKEGSPRLDVDVSSMLDADANEKLEKAVIH